MDKNAIKKYAVWARKELIARVTQKAEQYEITEKKTTPADADSIGGRVLTAAEKKQRQALIAKINQDGFEQVMEEVSYTWFNRFTALRFMEVNNYLPSHTRVFTNESGEFKPQILADAIQLDLEGLNMDKVFELKDANKTEELYKYLLTTQCNALSGILPRMFQKIEDYTELLLPDYLLREGSVIEQMIALIPEEDWTDQVQIIGWLYQYYNTEPKADIDARVKKGIKVSKQELPAKTQIFTPDWVVRFMVENSLGRLWIENHPKSSIVSEWSYYLDEAEQDTEVVPFVDGKDNRLKLISPELIRIIDPCMGSGHILCYIFDILVEMYRESGYSMQEAVRSILEKNIYGLDIDERASQLAYFSVMMKARQYDRRFLTRKDEFGNFSIPNPNVFAIVESNHLANSFIEEFCSGDKSIHTEVEKLIRSMKDAKEYGSLISVNGIDFELLEKRCNEMISDISMASLYLEEHFLPVIKVAQILSDKYDVVCTNPPYLGGGGMSDKMANFAKENYPLSKNDLFAIFLERGESLAKRGFFNCMVTMQSWMFLSSYEKLRNKILSNNTIVDLLHMDNQVMGIAFGTAVSVLRTTHIPGYKGTYCYVFNSDIKDDIPVEFPVSGNRFSQVPSSFYEEIPGQPIAYWISNRTREAFLSKDTIGTTAPPKQGLATADNNRFLRLWYEVKFSKIGLNIKSCQDAARSNKKWFPYNKGGAFRRWYGNRNYVVNWENDGYEIKNFKDDKGKVRSRPQNLQYYFRPAITWSDVTSGSFSGRYCEAGFMFDVKGSSGFPDEELLPYILGLLNSKVAQEFIKILNPTMTTQVGDMTRIPVLRSKEYFAEITGLVNECIELVKQDWNSFETSWEFVRHPLIRKVNTISEAYGEWEQECQKRFDRILENEVRINELFIEIYGLENELDSAVLPDNITVHKACVEDDIKSLISYAVGCMFGRYSLDYPGLIFSGDSWDDTKYETFKPDVDGIIPICDDEYFADDIVGKFITFIELVYGKQALEENLRYIADTLGGKGSPRKVIRNYFINNFFVDHCATYSIIGSGKRPIYWLFDSGKNNGFKCLIYIHRYQPDMIARIRTDYIHEQQSRYRTAIADLEQRLNDVSSSERIRLSKTLDKLRTQREEIRLYEEKIHHLADQMISIDLDDGVKHNYAIFKDVLAKIK